MLLTRKTGASALIGSVFVLFSGFYLVSLSLRIPFIPNASPVYFVGVVGTFFYLLIRVLLTPSRVILNSTMVLAFVSVFYFSLNQFALKGDLNMTVNVILCFIFYFIVSDTLKNSSIIVLVKVSELFILFSTFLLLIETVLRIRMVGNPLQYLVSMIGGGYQFYLLKRGSIMFADSNSTAFFGSIVFLFTDYISSKTNKNYLFQRLILLLVILFAFSRATLIALPVTLFARLLLSKINKPVMIVLVPILIILVAALIPPIASYISSDASFGTKTFVVERTLDYTKSSSLSALLLGVGFGGGRRLLGIWLHNFYITYYVESGLLGLCLIVCFFTSILRVTKWKSIYIIIYLSIVGFSFVPYAIPYLFVVFALMSILERRKFQKITENMND